MNNNVRIAKELLRIARSLMASETGLASLKDTDDIKFTNATDTGVDFHINAFETYKVGHEECPHTFEADGNVKREETDDGKVKFSVCVTKCDEYMRDENLVDEYSRPEYGMRDWGGEDPASVGDFMKHWDDVDRTFDAVDADTKGIQWVRKILDAAVDLAKECAKELAKLELLTMLEDEENMKEIAMWNGEDWDEEEEY